jgi:hypothetical protein
MLLYHQLDFCGVLGMHVQASMYRVALGICMPHAQNRKRFPVSALLPRVQELTHCDTDSERLHFHVEAKGAIFLTSVP